MNRIRRPCHCPAGPSARASATLAIAAALAAWRPDPPFPVGWRLPPGWIMHPLRPLGRVAGPVDNVPARIRAHNVVITGMHDWQIILIAAGAALLAAALAIFVHRLRAARRRSTADTRAMTAAAAIQTAAHPSLPPPGRHSLATGIPDAYRQVAHWPWQPCWPGLPRPTLNDPAQKRGHDHDR